MTNDRFLNEKDVIISKQDLYKDISINGIPVSINLKDMTPKDVILKSLTNITELSEDKLLESIKKSVYIPCLYIRYDNERNHKSYSLVKVSDYSSSRQYLDWLEINYDVTKINDIIIPVYTGIDYDDFVNKNIIEIKTIGEYCAPYIVIKNSDEKGNNIFPPNMVGSIYGRDSDEQNYFVKWLNDTKIINNNGKALIYLTFDINMKPKILDNDHNLFDIEIYLYFRINDKDQCISTIIRTGKYIEDTYQIMTGGSSSTKSSERWTNISDNDDTEPKYTSSSVPPIQPPPGEDIDIPSIDMYL